MSSRLEEIIEEIEEYVDNCKFQTLSSTKIIVNKEELEELLTELRMKTPEEIKKYQKIINNKDAILADAQTKADGIIADAQAKASSLISEHQIMQQAYAQANEVVQIATNQAQDILDNATEDANNIRTSAISYTDELMGGLENVLANAIAGSNEHFNGMMQILEQTHSVICKNRSELVPVQETAQTVPGAHAAADGLSVISSGSEE